jgi:hypothetical protein
MGEFYEANQEQQRELAISWLRERLDKLASLAGDNKKLDWLYGGETPILKPRKLHRRPVLEDQTKLLELLNGMVGTLQLLIDKDEAALYDFEFGGRDRIDDAIKEFLKTL